MEHTKHDKEHTSHKRRDGKSLEAILLDDAVDNNNKGTCRTTNLNFGTTKERYDKTSHNSGDNTLLGRYTRSNTKGNSQW